MTYPSLCRNFFNIVIVIIAYFVYHSDNTTKRWHVLAPAFELCLQFWEPYARMLSKWDWANWKKTKSDFAQKSYYIPLYFGGLILDIDSYFSRTHWVILFNK